MSAQTKSTSSPFASEAFMNASSERLGGYRYRETLIASVSFFSTRRHLRVAEKLGHLPPFLIPTHLKAADLCRGAAEVGNSFIHNRLQIHAQAPRLDRAAKEERAIAGPFSLFALGICLAAGMLPEASN